MMDIIKYATNWALGDAMQGKVMVIVGALALIALVIIIKGDNSILKGMTVPLGIVLLMNLGYGGFLTFNRPQHLAQVQVELQSNPEAVITSELEKATRDNKAYTILKKVWPWLIVVSILIGFFASNDYLKGLSMGLTGLFLIALLVDTFLHQRLEPYLQVLKQLNQTT